MSISLKQLSEGDGLTDIIKQLGALELSLDYGVFFQEYKVDWQLQRVMKPLDMYYFWSTNMLTSLTWAKSIAEFAGLFNGNQQVLFERNYALFSWLPVVYKCYQNQLESRGIPLGNGAYLPLTEEEYNQLPFVWKNIYGRVAYRLVEEVLDKMRKIEITYEEYLLLRLIALFTHHNLLSDDGVAVCEEISQLLCRAVKRLRGENSVTFLREVVSILKSLADIGNMETDELPNIIPSKKDWILPEANL